MAEETAAGEPVGPLAVKSELLRKARADKNGPAEATEADIQAQGRSSESNPSCSIPLLNYQRTKLRHLSM